MEEPKNPCGCGGSDSSQTRREFLQKAVVVGAGLSVAAIGLTVPTEAHAAEFNHELCIAAAEDAYNACMINAHNNSRWVVQRRAREFACEACFAADVAACDARLGLEAAFQVAQALTGQPGQATSTIVVGGIIFIVGAGLVFAL